jgi:excisionase family DNA binding protein
MATGERTPRLLSVGEVAAELGLRASTVRDWLFRRKLPFVRVGTRAVRVKREVVEQLIARGEVPAREPRAH